MRGSPMLPTTFALIGLTVWGLILCPPPEALAQSPPEVDWTALQTAIATDGSLSSAPTVLQGDAAGLFEISDSLGQRVGQNLFHSFEYFDLGAADTARFVGAPASNVISRITGGAASRIDGKLESQIHDPQGSGANFYFLNPSGVLVGPSSEFDLPASLALSTANRLEFSDGHFDSTDIEAAWDGSTCCEHGPTAYVFTGRDPVTAGDPAEIRIQTRLLSIPSGESFSALGGTVRVLGGRIYLDAGSIQVAATGNASARVPVDLATDSAWLSSIGDEALIEVRSGYLRSTFSGEPSGDGRVVLRGGRLELELAEIWAGGPDGGGVDLATRGGILLTDRSRVFDFSEGATSAGILIDSETLSLDSSAQIQAISGEIDIQTRGATRVEDGASIQTLTRYRFNRRPPVAAGAIRLDVGSLDLLSGGQVVSLSGGVRGIPDSETAGDIDIRAAGELRIEGVKQSGSLTQRSGIISRALADATSQAAGGNIHLHAGNLVMAESASISASSLSDAPAGGVNIIATTSIRLRGGFQAAGQELTEISTRGVGGGAGDVALNAPLIEVLEGAAISATSQGGGDAGGVTLHADRVRVTGQSTPEAGTTVSQVSAIFSESPADFYQLDPTTSELVLVRGGSAGSLLLRLQDSLEISQGGTLSVRTRGSGSAGVVDVLVEMGSIEISSGGLLNSESTATTEGAGAAGSLFVSAAGDLRIDAGGGLRATAEIVDAGNIFLEAGNLVSLVDGVVTTRSGSALGGNISLDAGQSIELVRSQLETDVGGDGNGGNIWIGQGSTNWPNPPNFAVLNASHITATAFAGKGGFISIAGDQYLKSPTSRVDASSELGEDGTVEVTAPEVQVSGNLEALSTSYLDVSALLQEHCAARRNTEGSSFTLEDRPGIGPEPGDYLPASVLPQRTAAAPALAPPSARPPVLPLPEQLAGFDAGCGRQWAFSAKNRQPRRAVVH